MKYPKKVSNHIEVIENPLVVHFCSAKNPWLLNSQNIQNFKSEFWFYRNKSLYKS